MQAMFTQEGLTLTFSRKEDFIGINLLESLAEMYEAQGVDASPIRNVVEAMKNPCRVTVQ